MEILNYILDMGGSVVMPIIITIIGLIFGQKFSKAFRSGMTIGIGLIGINLITGLMGDYVSPAAQAMVDRFGINLSVVDVGWPVSSAIAFATTIVPWVFVTCFVLNIIMLATNTTKTLNIDIWNYWHFILTGSLVQTATGSLILGVIASGLTFIIVMKFADYSAPRVQEYFGLPNVSTPHTETVSWAPLCILLDKIYDKIPGFNKIKLDGDTIQEKLGFLGDPIVLGLILGAFIGLLAGYEPNALITLAVQMSAVMFLLPRMVKILMEGLMPLSEDAKKFMAKRFPGKEVYIGMDAAIATGSPMVVSAALLMIPITLLLAVILPGNKLLPLVDLSTLPFFMIWPVVASRGNLLRAIITGCLMMIAILYIGTDLSGTATAVAQATNFAFPEGATAISSLDIGAHLVPYIIYKILALF
ncbi:MAG TPA: PTS galactitol transporter subunit IIC [Candidatus Anaerostipes avistercoris]|uniref:PTS galactitol transporter subunit IIC n=1 Tax=Candidatus Anaerostipes avistercoris TaxID=2838462 RepID=A0A9D2PIL6_9FIRM|nr:PTS transporter subunit IIC [uncultured Anaerostipes sp.]HJC51456.1 PTS galactitol transporter subunit IIC [Candidatus Anaerostipes avistercoris]